MNPSRCVFAWTLAAAAALAPAQGFEVEPYLQPGDAPTLVREGKVVLWQTASPDDAFGVEFGLVGGRSRGVRADATLLPTGSTLYSAPLAALAFDSDYFYRVRRGGRVVFESRFATRTRRSKFEFAVLGDTGNGSLGEALVASAVHRAQPSFVLVTGDLVYSSGRASEYAKNLFPYYNAPERKAGVGAPLMRTTPFYVGLGNHDMAAPNLDRSPDGLAAFYYLRQPLNGPILQSAPTVSGGKEVLDRFAAASGDRWPVMANYWFDVGNARIAVLDANGYANPVEPALVEWLAAAFEGSRAKWRFVAFHQPGFHTSRVHYAYQKMRLLAPLFERLGVDVVFSGHVHNYQRTKPLRFAPKGGVRANGTVAGAFTLDEAFDGALRPKPRGVTYLVTGAGGASLYDPDLTNRPERWEREGDSWAPFTERLVSNTHSFTRVAIDGDRMRIAQIDPYGNELDAFTIAK